MLPLDFAIAETVCRQATDEGNRHGARQVRSRPKKETRHRMSEEAEETNKEQEVLVMLVFYSYYYYFC